MKKSIVKSSFALLLALCMMLSYMPTYMFAYAEEVPTDEQVEMQSETAETPAPEANEVTDNNAEEAAPAAQPTESESASDVPSTGETEEKTKEQPVKEETQKTEPAMTAGTEPDDDDGNTADPDSMPSADAQAVKFVIKGASSVKAWIEGISAGEFSRNADTGEIEVTYDKTIANGDTIMMPANTDIIFEGIPNKYINISIGETQALAEKNISSISPDKGKPATVGTSGECVVIVDVADAQAETGMTEVGEGEETVVNWSFITPEDENGTGKNKLSDIVVGDEFKGSGVCTSWNYNSGAGPSHANIKITTSSLPELVGRKIYTHCTSGKHYALALKGAKFSYTATVTSIKKGKIKFAITFHPRDRHNVSYGTLTNAHAPTQQMAGSVTITNYMDITVHKVDNDKHYNYPENYKLNGAQFQIYEDEACTDKANDKDGDNALLTTDEKGNSKTITLIAKDYWIKEIKAPSGFKMAPAAPVEDEELTVVEQPIYPKVKVVKEPAKTNTNFLQFPNNYTLKGAKYKMYKADGTEAKDVKGNVVEFVTDENGNTPEVKVDLGSYYIEEVTASKGFMLDPKKYSFVLTEEYETKPYVVTSVEDPTYETLKMYLQKDNEHKSWSELTGAIYELRYYDVDSSTPVDKLPKVATRTWRFETTIHTKNSDNGTDKYAGVDFAKDALITGSDSSVEEPAGTRIIPCGVFVVEEVKAPEKLARDTTIYDGTVAQPSNGKAAVKKFVVDDNSPMSVHTEALRHYESEQHIAIQVQKVNAETGKPEALGHAELKDGVFEVLKMPYENATDKMVKVGEIVTDEKGFGELTTDSTKKGDDKRLTAGFYVVREKDAPRGFVVNTGYQAIEAIADEINTAKFTYSTEVPDVETETFFHKTDITSGIKELPGAKLQILEGDKVIEEWTSTDKPHRVRGLEGTYTLREITAPFGYECAEDVEFTVKNDKVTSHVSMDNKPIEIKTTATDSVTNGHTATPSATTTLKDVVEYKNLLKNKTYTMKGKLMDKETGKEILDKNGQPITAEQTFETGDKTEGTMEMTFTFDSSLLKGKTTVVFEDLYRDDLYLATHADINDFGQSVGFPDIHTMALDKESRTHNLFAGEGQTIVDTVSFKGLSPLETYTMTGTLFDKTTGELTTVKATKEFKPEATEGTVDIEFNLDGTGLEGHTFVVYEMVAIGNIELVKHENPDDEDQSVYVPEIGTQAALVDKDVEDTIEYHNLIPGQKYVARGYLVDPKTEKKLKDSDGETEFVAEAADGEVVVTLPIEHYSKLAGRKLVAFEEMYVISEVDGQEKETLIAEHKDAEDEDQTVKIPGTPKTGDNSNMMIYGLIGLGAAALLAGILVGRNRKKKGDADKENADK